jgi:hypothetical protein
MKSIFNKIKNYTQVIYIYGKKGKVIPVQALEALRVA